MTGAVNGQDNTPAGRAGVARSRPLVLLRARSSAGAERAGVVHLALVPETTGAVSALCGVLLHPAEHEMVSAGTGVPCVGCVLSHAQHHAPDDTPDGLTGDERAAPVPDLTAAEVTPQGAARTYQAWGWPVTVRRHQVWLTLGESVVAVLLPSTLALKVTALLTCRRCAPAVLTHPDPPEHLVLLGGEPFGVRMPYPPEVHRVSGTLLLPPTNTPRGPLTWIHPPDSHALRWCREIDIVAALRALRDPPPVSEPLHF